MKKKKKKDTFNMTNNSNLFLCNGFNALYLKKNKHEGERKVIDGETKPKFHLSNPSTYKIISERT